MEQEEFEPRVYLVVVHVISTKNRGIQIYWNKFSELGSLLSECELIAQLTKLWQKKTATNCSFCGNLSNADSKGLSLFNTVEDNLAPKLTDR